jgi:head-tail adaptor
MTIQRLVPSQDATTGVITDTWATFATEWARYRPSTLREFVAAGISASKVIGAVEMHQLDGVLPSMRIVDGDHTYQIEGVLADERSGWDRLTLPVSEIVGG